MRHCQLLLGVFLCLPLSPSPGHTIFQHIWQIKLYTMGYSMQWHKSRAKKAHSTDFCWFFWLTLYDLQLSSVLTRRLRSTFLAITSVKWRKKDDGQRQHATRCCNLKTNSLPLSVYVWKNNEAKIETKIKPCLPRKLLRVNSTGAGAEGGSASASKFIYLKFQLFA